VPGNSTGVETIEHYLEALASAAPTPGGGSAATIVGATGAALVAMVARICERNPAYAQWGDLALDVIREADELRSQLLGLRERDEAAFAAVVAAQALPKATDDEKQARRKTLDAALYHAAAEPLHGARLAFDVIMVALKTLEIPNRNLASDVGCAAEFAYAALAACAYNVRVNHRFMHDDDRIATQEHHLKSYETEGASMLDTIRSVVAKRLAR
jgi:methenyltetrahydrofolate cyclohydrolase